MVSSLAGPPPRSSLPPPTRLAASTLALTSSSSSRPSQSLSHAPSVSSRTSTVRRSHRHNRSHHGGSTPTYRPQNEFPIFAHTGDVEICIGPSGGAPQERRYLLHRLILAQCSGFFEAGTSEQWSRAQQQQGQTPGQELSRIGENKTDEEEDGTERAATVFSSRRSSAGSGTTAVGRTSTAGEPKMRWRYELDWGGTEKDDMPMLMQKVRPRRMRCRVLVRVAC